MNVAIKQHKSGMTSKYDISTSQGDYYAERKFFSIGAKLTVWTGDVEAAKITGHFSLFRKSYDIELTGGTIYAARTESCWKGVYTCEGNGESYRLYAHRGHNYSVFQGGTQIAAFTKNAISIGMGDEYELRINRNANLLLLICLVLAMDDIYSEGHKETINLDFGRIGPEGRRFDETWEPN